MKYKLTKELPRFDIGTLFQKDNYWRYQIFTDNGSEWERCSAKADMLNDAFSEGWFEPIEDEKPKRWRAGLGRAYWYYDDMQGVNKDEDYSQLGDHYRYEAGNYFRTAEQAEAAAEAIKALLSYIHNSQDQPARDLTAPAGRAWRLLHPGQGAEGHDD